MAGALTRWEGFAASAPEIASAGRRLLSADGTGVAFLATVRRDGGPRVHPVAPVLAEGSLWVFVVNLGWKYHDLRRDGRYALHSSPTPAGGEEFYVTGSARESGDPGERAVVRAAAG
ncbi:MAG: pyridoxamine 5'-phosphate oxidase family protein, partial [bacterium]